jgi:hypothetical protein
MPYWELRFYMTTSVQYHRPSVAMSIQPSNRQQVVQRLLEIYRSSQYRTTSKGRKVQWDEPGEDDTPEVRRHNAFLAQQLQKKRESKDRLKTKGAVPTKNGKPIFESPQEITENLQQVLMSFRRQYQSNRPLRFREWIQVVAGLLDDLT